tara:strand:- start:363 stop:605 length:243 start_codon:yes stop_codon:yes gene_type:complete
MPEANWPNDESTRAFLATHWQEPWGDRRQEIIFIGSGIDWPWLQMELNACPLPEDLVSNPTSIPNLTEPFPIWKRLQIAA